MIRRSLSAALLLVLVVACRQVASAWAPLSISCGGNSLAPASVDVLLDSAAGAGAGSLTIKAMPGSIATGTSGSVEIAAAGGKAPCSAPGGSFHIEIGGNPPIDGTLRIAAMGPVQIAVRTAAGVQRGALTFDPTKSPTTQIKWGAGQ
jgi:hypothetical protein